MGVGKWLDRKIRGTPEERKVRKDFNESKKELTKRAEMEGEMKGAIKRAKKKGFDKGYGGGGGFTGTIEKMGAFGAGFASGGLGIEMDIPRAPKSSRKSRRNSPRRERVVYVERRRPRRRNKTKRNRDPRELYPFTG